MVEDESDVKAAKELKEEVQADIAEFDENNLELIEGENMAGDETSQAYDMNRLENEFKSIETEVNKLKKINLFRK